MNPFKLIGHRGYGPTDPGVETQYPENSLQAFRYALQSGADGIELDVFMSADGVPIVIHDKRLFEHVVEAQVEKCQGKSVTDFTFEELQEFDIGNGERIPSLDQVFELVKEFSGKRIINLDVKGADAIPEIINVMDKYKSEDFNHDIIVSSYDWNLLRTFRHSSDDVKLVPAIKTVMLFGAENVSMPGYLPLTDKYQPGFEAPILELHEEIRCYAFDCAIPDYTPGLIDLARKQKVGLQLSTGNSRVPAAETDYGILQQLAQSTAEGVPFVICKVDEPDLVRQKIESDRDQMPVFKKKHPRP